MLHGKNAIITGARQGIGRATVEVFARNRANIWACARTEDAEFEAEMEEIARQNDIWVEPVYFDMTDYSQMKNAVQKIVKEKRNIDILINNAGVVQYDLFSMMQIDSLNDMLFSNYIAPLQLTQMIARRMGKNGMGSIVFLSSVSGIISEAGNTAYGGSKAALAHAAGVLSKELAPMNIRVNAVAPGLVNTRMKDKAEPDAWNELIKKTNLKRMAEPEEIANVLCFLSSDLSSYITGQVIRVDGGLNG